MKHIGRVEPAPRGLVEAGPLVQIVLAPEKAAAAALAASGKTVPPPITTKFMVDTGAQRTIVDDRLAQKFGLPPIRYDSIVGVSGKPEDRPVYRMTIGISMSASGEGKALGRIEFSTDVVGMASPPAPTLHSGLLGRDFLRHVEFKYHGLNGMFEIIVPDNRKGATPTKSKAERKKDKAKRKARQQSKKKNRR